MKKYILIAVLSLLVLGVAAWFIVNGVSKQTPVAPTSGEVTNESPAKVEVSAPVIASDSPPAPSNSSFNQKAALVVQSANSNPAGWKSYTNSKLGFAFRYPGTWFKDGDDANVTNLKGAVTEVDIQLRDSSSGTSLSIAYHLAPAGASLFSYAQSQFKSKQGWYASGAKEITIAGNMALMADNITKSDGRGRALTNPLKTVLLDFLDKSGTGEFQFQFQTPVSGAEKQVALFDQVVAGFKFTK